MIKAKNKKCIECGREDQPWFSKKRCKSCAAKSYGKPKQITDKQKVKKKIQSTERDVYFKYHISQCTHSEETGKAIYEPNRGNICHILDKGRHKSLQGNLDNYIYLTIQEHTTLDNHLFKLEFDKIEEKLPNSWKIICERVQKLLPLCQEKSKLYFKFKEYLEL
jgi:hypothetical protein